MSEPAEVIVVVRGGVVQGAKANLPVTVHVLDYDNMEAAAKDEPSAKEEYDYLLELEKRWESMELAVL